MRWRRKKQLLVEQLALLEKQKQLLNTIRTKQHKTYHKMLWIGLLGFFIHCFMCATIFLFPDIPKVNADIYYCLKALHIPVYSPQGWNMNYVSGCILNIGIWAYAFKISQGFLFKNTTKLDGKSFILRNSARLFFCLFLILFVFTAYISPLPAHSTSCTIHSLCWLQSENMFVFSTFVSYLSFWAIGFLTFSLSCT